MNLSLTRRGDYVVRAAAYLASVWHDRRFHRIKDVAGAMALPPSYTPHVLAILQRAGIAEARAGRGGGYRLAHPPDEVRLLDVVEAAEGELSSERCILRGGPCHWDGACAVHPAWSAATDRFRQTLAATTLGSVVRVDLSLRRGATLHPNGS